MKFLAFLLLLTSHVAYGADYSAALNNAKTAFLVQSGLQGNIDKAGQYGLAQLKVLGVDTEFGAVAFAYRTYRDKSGSINLGGGKKLLLNLNSATLSLPINWK